jgi:hypothetical protein
LQKEVYNYKMEEKGLREFYSSGVGFPIVERHSIREGARSGRGLLLSSGSDIKVYQAYLVWFALAIRQDGRVSKQDYENHGMEKVFL